MATSLTAFPYGFSGLSNITPFTYSDGLTYLEALEALRVYVNDSLRPEFDAVTAGYYQQFLDGVANAEATITADTVTRQAAYDVFVTATNAAVMTINNRVGPEQMHRVTVSAGATITVDPLWPDAHPFLFQVKQDSLGNVTPVFGAGITSNVVFDTTANAVTEFLMIPNGAGSWHAMQYTSGLNNGVTDTNVSALIGRAGSLVGSAIDTHVAGAITTGDNSVRTDMTTLANNALGVANSHHTRHEYGGADQVALDKRQVSEPVRDWVQNGLALSPAAPFRVFFMGDSITNDGSLESNTAGDQLWGGGKGYSYRLANLLTKGGVQSAQSGTAGVGTNAQPGVHVWSSAVAGTRSDNYAPAGTITNVNLVQPELVFHMIGTNDFALQLSPDSYYTNVLAAINNVWGVAPNARQVFIMPWPRINPDGMAHAWSEYKAKLILIRDLLKADNRFSMFEYGSTLERTGGMQLTPWANQFSDGIHGVPSWHRGLAEALATWLGLPSPLAVFGPTRAIQGTKCAGGALDDNNPASSLNIHAAPVPRTVTLKIRILATVNTTEGDVKIQMVDDQLVKTIYPFHVQPNSLRTLSFELQLEIPPNTNRYFYLSGTSGIIVSAGAGYDQYNQFWAETSYI